MADNTYYGAGTYGQGNYQPYQVAPDPIGDGEAVGAPAVAFSSSISAPSIGDQETVGTPATSTTVTAAPSSVNDLNTVGSPTASVGAPASPGSAADADTIGAPAVATSSTVAPTQIADTAVAGTPAVTVNLSTTPTSAADTDAVGAPSAALAAATAPTAVGDLDAVGQPSAGYNTFGNGVYGTGIYYGASGTANQSSTPYSINDADALNGPAAFSSSQLGPASIADAESIGAPSGAATTTVAPDGLNDTDTVGAPAPNAGANLTPGQVADTDALGAPSLGTDTFGTGTYGNGIYYGTSGMPDQITYPASINDTDTIGEPLLLITLTVVPDPAANTESVGKPSVSLAMSLSPDGAADPETLGFPQTGTGGYNSGPYGAGVYSGLYLPDDQTAAPTPVADWDAVGSPAVSFTASVNQNNTYNGGLYGEGIYFGSPDSADTDDPDFTEAEPLWQPRAYYPPLQPQHILGIGPWSESIIWRGAPNYGVPAGRLPARPVMALPFAVSSSFTLRVNAGSEASASFEFSRANTAIPEEMSTDLWWRRRDPESKALEMIGRFNTAQSDVSSSDVGVSVSSQFTCYRTLLADRMVLKYKDTKNSENLWDKGTPVVEIMRFAVPDNMGLDLAGIGIGDPYNLGVITTPFELPLGSTVDEVFNNLLEISAKQWEWWVEAPLDVTKAPKLSFVVGTQGSDRGVTLFDAGSGPTAIAQWSMANYVSRYANSLYFIGRDGGETQILDEQVALYGQRDASDSDSSVPGDIDKTTGLPTQLDHATAKRLAALADRRPTFTIQLRTGFWRGRSHIDAGDTIGVYIRLGSQLLQGKYRCTELQVDIDGNGVENVTLTLGKPLTSGDPRSRHSAMSRIVARLKNYERKGP